MKSIIHKTLIIALSITVFIQYYFEKFVIIENKFDYWITFWISVFIIIEFVSRPKQHNFK